ncbi:uncharacterized protein PITG_03273 [Phytophthora infestans T30-4]|uniref:Uncharacterized protein n=2 Tax=Phytophthora infestans TaxID=4787 RepID=D0MZT6_PHYIT|nr:uncharacterized protein PITG_03273 [Phytophthora infestans T30-4]EEY65749.1 conserved hypothetical protein [Phytophthora infestans T30-4]KAF4047228.1 hypothetical protein GN244_ATG00362 [Phytophthora infestans]KAF4139497.1 hypothetical protein GN958_ATG11398 [Phytophthora infestans]KAI9995623.1 hypothetical protein PInf_012688 [Phytophthora infestans]|eukprot:XP_002906348.1 conserved hypothetical protein [Phytophthora infestans T30-4]
MANSTDKPAPALVEHHHQPTGDCPHAVASTIIQRHRDNRQRFDSADYEMAQRASGPCAGCTCGKCAPSDGNELEREPEPGTAEAREQLRCLRMQRFDSADWALQAQRAQQNPQTDSPATEPANVAQMLMDRHALKTCAFVGPAPVKGDERNTSKA